MTPEQGGHSVDLMRSHPIVLSLLIALLAPLSVARAEAPLPPAETSAEEHSRRGVQFYAEGKLPEAVREMLKAYELAPESGLLYNIARIYQKMGQRDLAIHYLKTFVTQPGADPDRVQKALEHLEELNRAAATPAPPPAPSVEEAAPEPEPAEAAPAAEPEPAASPEPISVAPEAASSPDHTAAWVSFGVGGGALIVGGILGGLAMDSASEFNRPGIDYAAKRSAYRRSRSYALGADVCVGVGLAAATVGLVLLLTGGDAPPAASVAPSLSPEHAGAQLIVRFP